VGKGPEEVLRDGDDFLMLADLDELVRALAGLGVGFRHLGGESLGAYPARGSG